MVFTDAEMSKDMRMMRTLFRTSPNFQVLNECFDSFLAGNAPGNGGQATTFAIDTVLYLHGEQLYRATCSESTMSSGTTVFLYQHINLAHDGFFCAHREAQLMVVETAAQGTDGLHCLLAHTELSKFPSLVAFSKKFLCTETPKFQVLFDSHKERIVFKALSTEVVPNKVLMVTFESGYPESPVEHMWYNEEGVEDEEEAEEER